MSLTELGVVAIVLVASYGITARLSIPEALLNVIDRPNERSLHTRPTPRTGGLAILAGCALGLSAMSLLGIEGPEMGRLPSSTASDVKPWLCGAALVMGVVSFLDDRLGLSPTLRLAVHGLTAAGFVRGTGLALNEVPLPLVGAVSLGPLAGMVSVAFLVWMANLYNFMDGMDGFAGGMTVVGFGFLALIAYGAGHKVLGALAVLVVAATAGFLLHNLPPARIFMGDTGSVPIGFLAGALSLLGVRDGGFDIWVPALIFSPFIVDASLTLLLRIARGERFWLAHRQHYYQRLVVVGWGHRRTVLVEYGLMLASGIAACFYLLSSESGKLVVLGASAVGYASLVLGVRHVERTHVVAQRGAG